MPARQLLEVNACGIYCAQGDFYIDPWKSVDKALITHGHSDHARWGMQHYLATHETAAIMRHRINPTGTLTGIGFGEKRNMNGVEVSFHPAGHVIGSAQIRVEYKGEVWVVTGDCKLADDGLSGVFEPIKCDTIIIESTFGLPVFRWRPHAELMREVNEWWAGNAEKGLCSVLYCYSLGKAQRILHALNAEQGQILLHGATHAMTEVIAGLGYAFPPSALITKDTPKEAYRGAMVLAPGSAQGSPWLRKMAPYVEGNASGWMALRGNKRRRALDKGFVISDHADFYELNAIVEASGAENVLVTHGYTSAFARYQTSLGRNGRELETAYGGDEQPEAHETPETSENEASETEGGAS